MSKLSAPTTTFYSTEVNNNEKASRKNNNGVVSKKSLVKLTNREGSTRSLSCFKNPEMSSKDLPLSEEMTVNMYSTNFESNTGLRKKSKTSTKTDHQQTAMIHHLEEVENVNGGRGGKPANNSHVISDESSSTRTVKLSEAFIANDDDKKENDEYGNSTENFKRKWEGGHAEERSNKDLKRTNALDRDTQSGSIEFSEEKLSNMLIHREKVASIAARELKDRNGTDDEIDHKINDEQILQVQQRKFESEKRSGKYEFNSNSQNDTPQHSKISSKDNIESNHNSVKKIRDQFDSFDAVEEQTSQRKVGKDGFVSKQKQTLEMKKSPPLNLEWKENVDVPLWRSNSGETDDSNSLITTEIKESRVDKILSGRELYDVNSEGNLQNGNYHRVVESKKSFSWDTDDNVYSDEVTVSENRFKNEPIIKGNVGERMEFFSSLDKRSPYGHLDRQTYDRTTKPKHLEYFENIDRDQHRHKNLRGRTEANRQKIGKRDIPEVRVNDDLKESLKHIYSKPLTQKKLFVRQQYSRNLNENGELDNNMYTNDTNGPNSIMSRNYVDVTSRRNVDEVNDGDSPVSDALSDDKESVGEYELHPRSGRSQVPSDDQIQKMIEENRRTLNSNNIPTDQMKSSSEYTKFSTFKPDEDNFYDELDKLNNAVNKERQKYVKKPRGPGPSYDRIFMEDEGRQRPRENMPLPSAPNRDIYDENDDYDDYEEFFENDQDTHYNDDEMNTTEQEASIKTITKTITRQIKQTIPSGIVTLASEEKKIKKVDNRVTGTIISYQEKPRQTLEKSSVSGFLNVDKEVPIPVEPPRREQNIEVVTKNNPIAQESRNHFPFDNRNNTSEPSHVYRHESLKDNYNERMLATPFVDTELGVDAELRDAKKTGSTYRITMNLTPSLLVSSRPPSVIPMPNSTSFVSRPFSPTSFISQHNQISRHNSNTSSETQTRHMNGYGTLSSVAPSVFSPPAQVAPLKPNVQSQLDTNRNIGSGKVVVSLPGVKNNTPYQQDDVAFNLSLRGNKPMMPAGSTGLMVSQIKSSPSRNENFGEEIVEKVETTITSAPVETSGTTRRNKYSVNSRTSSPRRLAAENPEKNVVRSSKSEQRQLVEGGRSKSQSSRPEILYSALDEPDTFDGLSSKKFQTSKESSELTTSRRLGRRNEEIREESNAVINHRIDQSPPIVKTPLQSLDEEGNFDREVGINKTFFGNYGNTGTNVRTDMESHEFRESVGSVSSGRRMEQINKFDLQALLQGAAADSIKQRINVKRLGDRLFNGPKISEAMKECMARDELPPSEDDRVAEEISMNIDNGKVTMTSEILCQKTVPIYNSQDMYKTSSVLLIRIIEVDLSVTPERKKLYELLVGPNIEKRPLSDNEKKELYKKFMTLAEHSRKGLLC